MSELSFDAICGEYVCDKAWHRYGAVYELLIGPRREQIERILEIGVAFGASMQVFAKWCPNAKVVGIDPAQASSEIEWPRVEVLQGKASDPEIFAAAQERGPYDLIVDDGTHNLRSQMEHFAAYYPLLKVGGCYVIEELALWGGNSRDFRLTDWLRNVTTFTVTCPARRSPEPRDLLLFAPRLVAVVRQRQDVQATVEAFTRVFAPH